MRSNSGANGKESEETDGSVSDLSS
jgi:hypothetical protein